MRNITFYFFNILQIISIPFSITLMVSVFYRLLHSAFTFYNTFAFFSSEKGVVLDLGGDGVMSLLFSPGYKHDMLNPDSL